MLHCPAALWPCTMVLDIPSHQQSLSHVACLQTLKLCSSHNVHLLTHVCCYPPTLFDTASAAHVNALTSFDTELPYDYYTLPFCPPAEGIKRIANSANPGTILQGLRTENSPYNFTMKVGMPSRFAAPLSSYCKPATVQLLY